MFFQNLLILLFLLMCGSFLPLIGCFLLKKRFRLGSRFFLLIAMLFVVAQSSVWMDTTLGFQNDRHYQSIRDILQDTSITSPRDKGLDWEHSLLAMSMTAEGLAGYSKTHPEKQEEVSRMLNRLVEMTLDTTFWYSIEHQQTWEGNQLYLSHLGIMILAYKEVSGVIEYDERAREISQFIVKAYQKSSNDLLYSYRSLASKWPCDNTAMLHYLNRYDQLFEENLAQVPTKNFLTALENSFNHSPTNLPCTEVQAPNNCHMVPRGHSLSWMTTYMKSFQADKSAEIWRRYKSLFKHSYLYIGAAFQEFPNGFPEFIDYDSGPIVIGVGGAASGLALQSAAYQEDRLTFYQLNNTMYLIDFIIWLQELNGEESELRPYAYDFLATSIKFKALNQ